MDLKIIGGSSHKKFNEAICKHLGIRETKTQSFKFSNDNRFVVIDEPVRGDDVFVIQTQLKPVNSHIMELLMLIRTLKSSSAGRITVVLPYFFYSRSDKKDQPRICITAKLIADLLETAGADRILTMELHSSQVQGFANVPFDHIVAAPDVIQYLKENWKLDDYVLVAGDSGAAKLVEPYADGLHLPIAMIDKRRIGNDEKVKIKSVLGDVKGKKCLIIDDETLSGGTLIEDAKYLLEEAGAIEVDACFIHANLGEGAAEKLNNSPIKKFLTTDTIPTDHQKMRDLEIVSVTKRFANFINRIHNNESVKTLNDVV
ncbi:ribose-phosphate pyrophosphokinase [Candidatus Parcubacteria bacterium]|jgi:ribose-phosphate pyrophosphokinase|nr:ribose-phosphate pyrophosphokinase [Candidatus Parcubacteria bacterium]